MLEPELRWRKTDESIELIHCPNHQEQSLLYARIYTARQGYSFSATNQLVLNLKMSPNAPAQRLRYKRQAIRQFAQEVIELLRRLPPERSLTLVPMPPSKERSHPEYDDRMEQVAGAIAAEFTNVEWLPLLQSTGSRESSHLRSGRRDPNEIYRLMAIDPSERISGNTEAVAKGSG